MDGSTDTTKTASYFDSYVDRVRSIDIATFAARYAIDVAAEGPEKVAEIIKRSTFVGPTPDNAKRFWLLQADARDIANRAIDRLNELRRQADERECEIPDDDPLQLEYAAAGNTLEDAKRDMKLGLFFMTEEMQLVYPGVIPEQSMVFIHPETHELGYTPAKRGPVSYAVLIGAGDLGAVFGDEH